MSLMDLVGLDVVRLFDREVVSHDSDPSLMTGLDLEDLLSSSCLSLLLVTSSSSAGDDDLLLVARERH